MGVLDRVLGVTSNWKLMGGKSGSVRQKNKKRHAAPAALELYTGGQSAGGAAGGQPASNLNVQVDQSQAQAAIAAQAAQQRAAAPQPPQQHLVVERGYRRLSVSDDDPVNEEVVQEEVDHPPPVPVRHVPHRELNNHTNNEVGWQVSQGTLRERNRVMFNNENMSDVHFLVGTVSSESSPTSSRRQRIPAHKYVLAVGSSVFHAMFYGPLADQENRSTDIEVPDLEPVAFLNLLRYLYSDEIQLEPESVLGTLYAAKKYMVPAVTRSCVQFLESSLSARNACMLLSQSRLFDEPELVQRCWEVIDAQAEEAMEAEGFADIDHGTLCAVLERETLVCREICLFRAAQRWAVASCERDSLDPTASNQRVQLGRALQLLRVPAMKLEEFANQVAQSGLLELQEVTDIFLHFTATEKPCLSFVSGQRRGLTPKRVHRFQSCAFRSNQWRYRGRCDSIQFQTDVRVFLAGLGLYGSSNGAHEYSVRLELKRGGLVLGQAHTKFRSDGTSQTFPVFFERPIQVEPTIWYTASAVLDGLELSYFGQEGMAEVNTPQCTFQFQCSADSTNGTGVQGGQIPELIFYG